MLRWMLLSVCALLLMGQTEEKSPPIRPVETQAATRPAPTNTVLRRPAQADILKNLLSREARPAPIKPQDPQTGKVDQPGEPLLLEGSFVVERPGRLVHEDGRAKFVFLEEGGAPALRTMEILPNQLLEMMEREADSGFAEFVISAEVTRYKGTNYLILRKILRRVGHGNLTP